MSTPPPRTAYFDFERDEGRRGGREYYTIGSQQGDESPQREQSRAQEDLVSRQIELLSQVINMKNNPRSTIRVEPRINWPKLGDDNTGGKDVIDFYDRLEEIFGLANNGQGMSATERLVALKNCLSKTVGRMKK